MTPDSKPSLADLGWDHFFGQQIADLPEASFPARVARQDINQFQLKSEQGDLTGILPGRWRQEAFSKADLPTVGDWVTVTPIPQDQGKVQIGSLLERKSKFSRKEAGEVVDEQIVAANVDTVFIVSGLDDDFNPKRIERYLLLSWDSGALPVIVLNKEDLCDNLDEKLEALQMIAQGTPVLTMSAIEHEGIDALNDYIGAGKTCALMGSSGVGKSTIINCLLGYDRFATGSVRDDDSKGRHTTTFREMVMLPGGGLIIDTPGMREIQVWGDDANLSQSFLSKSFADIEELAVQCRFRDCAHQSEPGCAVRQAIEAGELDEERLERYVKLQREVEHFESQQTAATRAEKKQERRRFSKMVRNLPNKRD